jgi:hypothetical protein
MPSLDEQLISAAASSKKFIGPVDLWAELLVGVPVLAC